MKKNLRLKIASTLAAGAMLFGLTSCDMLSSGVSFTDEKSAEKINELLKENISSDLLVYEIEFDHSESSSSFSFNKDEITIISVDPENVSKLNGLDIDIKSGATSTNSFYERKTVVSAVKYKGYKVENIDITPMIKATNEAIQLLKDEGTNVDGLGTCRIKFGATPSETVYVVNLQSKTGSNSREIIYDEITVDIDFEGNIIFED